jgi:hypothetical protein
MPDSTFFRCSIAFVVFVGGAKIAIVWEMAIYCCWLLVDGCWLMVVGCWLSVDG